ncbi:MAG: DUF4097 family beta strand repeat-containing protein [Candidatus Dojkabacteria bacterium]
MTLLQKIIKYCALVFAIILIVGIFKFAIDALLFVGGFLDKNQETEPLTKRNITFTFDEHKELDIRTKVTKLTLETGEDFSVTTNNKDITVEEKTDTIVINDNTNHLRYHNKNLELIVTLPTSKTLDFVKIETGAGKVFIEELNCKKAEINLGAGGLEVNDINVTDEIKMSGGVGEIIIHNGKLNNLKADLGVGKLDATLSLTGKNNIDTGVGEVNFRFLENSSNYTFDIEKGIGEIRFNGEKISSGVTGDGKNTIEISGGIGEINIETED